jgi:hypothetical protein
MCFNLRHLLRMVDIKLMPLTRREFSIIVKLFFEKNRDWKRSYTRFDDEGEIWSVAITPSPSPDGLLLGVVYSCGDTCYSAMMSGVGDFCVGLHTGSSFIYLDE